MKFRLPSLLLPFYLLARVGSDERQGRNSVVGVRLTLSMCLRSVISFGIYAGGMNSLNLCSIIAIWLTFSEPALRGVILLRVFSAGKCDEPVMSVYLVQP